MKTRDILIFAVALVLAVGVAYMSRLMLQSDGSSGTTQGKFKTVSILVAKADMPVGTRITDDKLQWQSWPEHSTTPHYITRKPSASTQEQAQVEQTVKSMSGAIVRYAIAAGEPIKSTNIINPNDKSILSAVIDPTKRAFTISLDRRAHISGHIASGDFVDVVVALRSQNKQRRGSVGSTVVSNVKVLAVDSALGNNEKGGEKPPKTITLEVSQSQAEDLAAALKDGTPAISLRSIADAGHAIESFGPPQNKESRSVVLMRGSEDITTINVKQ